jgi:hypothetical protein
MAFVGLVVTVDAGVSGGVCAAMLAKPQSTNAIGRAIFLKYIFVRSRGIFIRDSDAGVEDKF